MRAAWYDHRGPAHEVLQVGTMPTPEPGAGEIRIRILASGISPGDVKKRSGWQGSPMPYPRVIPHSDGAGSVDAVGEGVNNFRVGDVVWCYGAQSYRPFGTAAEYCIVPASLAVPLPSDSSPHLLEQAASLGIAGITGHRAVFADGPVEGLTVLVHGTAAGVGAIAAQMALRGGAQVIGVVRRADQADQARALGVQHVLDSTATDLVDQVRTLAPHGVHRIAEVDLAAHAELDSQVVAVGGTISSYYSSADRTVLPYWPLGFADVTLRLLGSDDFRQEAKTEAARELTAALLDDSLKVDIRHTFPLERIADSHEAVEAGTGRVVVIP